jgi:hypothetical protein
MTTCCRSIFNRSRLTTSVVHSEILDTKERPVKPASKNACLQSLHERNHTDRESPEG